VLGIRRNDASGIGESDSGCVGFRFAKNTLGQVFWKAGENMKFRPHYAICLCVGTALRLARAVAAQQVLAKHFDDLTCDLVFIRPKSFLANSKVQIFSKQVLQPLDNRCNREFEDPIEDDADADWAPDDPGKAKAHLTEKLKNLAAERGVGEPFEERIKFHPQHDLT
jgi:hypothetical protein